MSHNWRYVREANQELDGCKGTKVWTCTFCDKKEIGKTIPWFVDRDSPTECEDPSEQSPAVQEAAKVFKEEMAEETFLEEVRQFVHTPDKVGRIQALRNFMETYNE